MKPGRYHHITDNELLENYYADKNQLWIGILLERYTLLLLGVCMKYLKDEEEAKDSVQQVFLKVLTEVSKYRIGFFKSWLYMVAKNHCLMKLRSVQGKYLEELTEEMAAGRLETGPPEAGANERAYEFLEEALKELGEEQRQCVTLFYLQKNSYQQIAEKTGYSLLKVKSSIQNGKRNLKLALERKLKNKESS